MSRQFFIGFGVGSTIVGSAMGYILVKTRRNYGSAIVYLSSMVERAVEAGVEYDDFDLIAMDNIFRPKKNKIEESNDEETNA